MAISALFFCTLQTVCSMLQTIHTQTNRKLLIAPICLHLVLLVWKRDNGLPVYSEESGAERTIGDRGPFYSGRYRTNKPSHKNDLLEMGVVTSDLKLVALPPPGHIPSAEEVDGRGGSGIY